MTNTSSANQPGRFIVFEGNQGLGKTTQVKMMADYLEKKGIPHMVYYFPRYQSFFGRIASKFLRGELGSVKEVSPYLVSMIFANDRMMTRDSIREALAAGKIVITDRWVSSNMAVQAAKFDTQSEREMFIEWLYQMEYVIFEQPRPHQVIYLHAAPEVSLKRLADKQQAAHLEGKADIEEADEPLIRESDAMYEFIAGRALGWKEWTPVEVIDQQTGEAYSPEVLHQQIVEIIFGSIKEIFWSHWTGSYEIFPISGEPYLVTDEEPKKHAMIAKMIEDEEWTYYDRDEIGVTVWENPKYVSVEDAKKKD